MTNRLTKATVFPSTRALLEAGISCRQPGGRGWAVYWMEGGAELTLFPGGEGPQEANDIDEVIDWIGGDQEAVLTPASLKRFDTLEEVEETIAMARKARTFSYTITLDTEEFPRWLADHMTMLPWFSRHLLSVKDNQRADHWYGDNGRSQGDTYHVQTAQEARRGEQ